MYSAAIHRNQVREQLQQALLLLWRPVVLGLAVTVDSANIGNADAVSVVTITVCSRLRDCSPSLNGAISPDNVVVAYTPKAPGTVKLVNLFCTEFTTGTVGGAMYNDVIDHSHGVMEA